MLALALTAAGAMEPGGAIGLAAGAVEPAGAVEFAGGALAPQDVQVRAYLSAPQVGVGRQFVLNVEVSGVQQVDADPVLPPMDDFAQYRGAGTSTSIQMANGRTTVAVTYQYRFLALAEGSFEIGPVQVAAGGRSLATEPVALVVSSAPPAPQAGTDAGGAGAEIAPEDLFLETTVSKRRVFENEPVTVEYRLFTRLDVESYSISALPKATGFWTEELEQPNAPQVERMMRDGREYVTAVVRRTVVFPAGPGVKTLDPLTVEAQVRMRNRGRDPFGDLFGRSSLFASRVPVALTSRPLDVEVLPLPAAGRPASFDGHVGDLAVSTSVDRTAVQANEAVSFRVRLAGTGNLRSLGPPEIAFPPEFEVFPPETREDVSPGGGSLTGTRSFDYVLIPRVPGRATVPAVEVSAFDPGARAYSSSSSEPLVVEVAGVLGEAGGSGAGPTAVEPVRDEIRFIHVGEPRLRPTGRRLVDTAGFWLVLLVPPAALGGAAAFRRRRDRLEGDVAYARTRRAGRVAKKRLARAKSMVRDAHDDPREFHGEVAGALMGFLADKLNVAEAGLVREDASRAARERGVSPDTLERLFACLDDCDRQRFAPAGARREAPEAVLARAAALMGDLAAELDE